MANIDYTDCIDNGYILDTNMDNKGNLNSKDKIDSMDSIGNVYIIYDMPGIP